MDTNANTKGGEGLYQPLKSEKPLGGVGGGLYQPLKSEKPLSPPIPGGGGAVDTNDWCINYSGSPIIIAIYPLIR